MRHRWPGVSTEVYTHKTDMGSHRQGHRKCRTRSRTQSSKVPDVQWSWPRLVCPRFVWTGGGYHRNNEHDRQHCSLSQFSSFKVLRTSSVLLLLMLLFSCACPVLSQEECSPVLDCHPSSGDLLGNMTNQRSLEVTSTCGSDGETTVYRKSSQTLQKEDYYCNGSDPHPPEFMTDKTDEVLENFVFDNPVFLTYWQSELTISEQGNTPVRQNVTFNITSDFLIRYIRVIFISPHVDSQKDNSDMRPQALVIERRSELTEGEFVPWRYYAKDCAGTFPDVEEQQLDGTGPDYDALTAVCMEKYFSRDSSTHTNWGFGRQQVVFNPSLEYDEEFATSAALQRHFLASAIRLRLEIPADPEPLSSYYAIADLEVDGQCACFGHASVCTGPTEADCECHHNTQGENCEECLPLFNNKPWRMGARSQANACEDCQCNGHAASCHYDDEKEYGVCDDCIDNTAGDKCDFCVDFYYVNPDKDSPGECAGFDGADIITYQCDEWCIPCDCSTEGTVVDSLYTCDNYTGQCECKTNVAGRRCDQCRDTYWKLDVDDPDGCIDCTCDPQGTFASSNLCDKETGICICKDNTEGVACDRCKTGYFNLTIFDPEGCTPCDCDPGASTDILCPVDTGQCPCRNKIRGRMCEMAEPEYFVPGLDHLIMEAEFAEDASDYELARREESVSGWGLLQLPVDAILLFRDIKVPASVNYQVVMRYESDGIWTGASVTLTPNNSTLNPDDLYNCSGTMYAYGDTHTVEGRTNSRETNDDLADLGVDVNILDTLTLNNVTTLGTVCLSSEQSYTVTFRPGTPTNAGQLLLLDSVVLMADFHDLDGYLEAHGNGVTQLEIQICYIIVKALRDQTALSTNCTQYAYSLMSELYDGAIECDCQDLGSTSNKCQLRGGQCPCRENVMLRDCSVCEADHYGYNTGDGCTPCDCDPQGSLGPACNDTGFCDCKNKVTGAQCDVCIQDHYGLFMGNGCVECQCNMDYAINNTCSDRGQCICKPGIGGLFCDSCLDGYYNLTTEGCTPCGCDPSGGSSATCDKQTGICECKQRTTGDKCDQCLYEYFGLGDWDEEGCISCFCSGHSSNCSSAPGWHRTRMWNTWNLLDDVTAVQGLWGGVDGDGDPVEIVDLTEITGVTAQEVLKITNSGTNLQERDIYFTATQGYLGDKRSAYGQTLSFTLSMSLPVVEVSTTMAPDNSTNTTTPITDSPTVSPPAEMYDDDNDVILTGLHTDYELAADLPELPHENRTNYTLQLHEEAWRVVGDGRAPTYIEIIQVLAALKSILIRAKFTNETDSSVTLYGAQMFYAVESDTGDVEVNNIEQCNCPPEYDGQFCQLCAPGYKRVIVNGGAYEECVPCDCNDHEWGAIPCEAESGICNCTHNTVGDICQRCMDGFYGDATAGTPDDCRACLCPGNVVAEDVNVFASTCELSGNGHTCINCTEGHGGDHCEFCVDQWYGVPEDPLIDGGQCVMCECNDRADTCNSTSGWCVDCRNNTAGQECDICAPTYFGRAMLYECNECSCDTLGATGECDHRTGICECKPNVEGMSCDVCMPDTYDYQSGDGCFPCDCHLLGGLGTSCNLTTGQCTCRDHVTGRRCDLCEDTYWNINERTGCDNCDCTEEGTANITGDVFGTCDLESGQCQCDRPGIIGRTCDICAKGTKVDYTYVEGIYVGVYPACELCGQCYDSWAVKIDNVGKDIETQYLAALGVWDHYGNLTFDEVGPTLQNMRDNLTSVQSSIVTAQDLVEKLDYLDEGFDVVSSTAAALRLDLTQISAEVNVVEDLKEETLEFDGRISVESGSATTPAQLLQKTQDNLLRQEELNTEALASWQDIQNMTDVITRSNGSVSALTDQVNAAMLVLEEATAMRRAAENILYGEFLYNFNNNTASLDAVQDTLDDLARDLEDMKQSLEDTEGTVRAANVTINRANTEVGARTEDIQQSMEESQLTRFNSTQAQKAAQDAQTATTDYKALAATTKANMTSVLEDTVEAVRTLQNVSGQIAIGNNMAAVVEATVLRPLEDMVDITEEIEDTTVPAEQVEEVIRKAREGQVVAEEALAITQQAADASYRALEKVRGIQANLEESTSLRNHTETLLNTSTEYKTSIEAIIAEANEKASSAVSKAESTRDNIASLENFMDAISDCFQNKVTRTYIGRQLAVTADETLTNAEQVHQETEVKVTDLSRQTPAKSAEIERQYSELSTLQTDLAVIQKELDEIEQIADLARLQNEVSAQNSEMNTLQQELNALENDLDDLLSGLDLLDPDTATCTHN